ncbi:MAG: DNA mismatch repair protein MutL [uncultured Phycisphaerae bacterium]|uniref:DNA mismatch repair protein MutL n=1 Tax=uncultured Phycisphaerae bacterium TaxID=904963 RepID=A0A6J4NMB9_9BACT|nr:MAG: DNA mismatch repair protein MutL [uncultured Phycisphaerae bacterium]
MEHRRPIQQLSPSLVNRIAAGEVIERPANVVKELVENAVDAGATRVTVEVEDGGRALIRVIDDGSGIPPEDLPLAFASHATSKLTCDDDLFRIMTMGFRGEALASIGSVSHARVLSRTSGSDTAWEIHNRGGDVSAAQAAAGNVGTTIEVRNLFFNTPARRKFIKGTATEFGYISDMVTRLALPHPHVAFKLTHNGRTALDLPAAPPLDRWLSAWPKEFRPEKLDVDARDAELRVRGVIGLPELARPTGKYQYVYLNGRHIRDRFVIHALREAFRGLCEPGRHPAAVLMLEVPPQDVDVNVHPTKIEVRFRDSGRIHGLVLSAAREKLLASDLTPAAVPMRSDAADARASAEQSGLRQKLADFFKQQFDPGAVQPATSQPMLPPVGPEAGLRIADLGSRMEGEAAQADGNTAAEPVVAPARDGTREAPVVPSAPPAGTWAVPPFGAPVRPTTAAQSALRNPQSEIPSASAIQLHNSYLVVQSDDGMLIIDQHALHERVMYEELLARVSRGRMESQRLLIPEVVDVSSSQLALLEQVQPVLQRMGIDVSAIGPAAVAVQAFPSFLDRLEPAAFVRELLERGEQELLDLHHEELLHGVLDMMACKAAVKAGDPLTPQEIDALLARRELIDRSSNCPHGRPTTLRLTLRDLEKQFKRTGF